MENQNEVPQENPFQNAVKSIPEIKDGYCHGLQALGQNAQKVKFKDSKKLNGSVDIDKSTIALYPEANRWDYAIGYDGKAYFLEIHPANTSDVTTVIEKAKWLENWLATKATELKHIAAHPIYYWIPSGKYNILPNSPQYRKLAQSKIQLKNILKLPL